jgi:lysine-N-methylase
MAGDIQLRYMTRFGCIGPDCEDNCCHTWRVGVDQKTYDKLRLATASNPAERLRFQTHFVKTTLPKQKRSHAQRRAGRKPIPQYHIDMLPNGNCPMLEDNGFCHIQAKYGASMLPNICASYPRRFNRIAGHLEQTAVISCPEVARQLLLHEDAIDVVALDPDGVERMMLHETRDLRDIRPFWRLQTEVRDFVWGLLRDKEYSVQQRLFFVAYFAHRTNAILTKDAIDYDEEHIGEARAKVRHEIARPRSEVVLKEIQRRLESVEAPSAMVILLAREIVATRVAGKPRESFIKLVGDLIDSYASLGELLGEDGAVAALRSDLVTDRVFTEYQRRRDRILEVAGARVDQYLTNFAFHYWTHRPYFEAPDIMTHHMRLLAEMAVLKFLFYGDPRLQTALDEGDEDFQTTLDAVLINVVYSMARFIEHGTLLKNLEKGLTQRGLFSLAGALYLVRF